jgi:membrane fusion protein, copper/silver efflux system
MRKRLRNKLAVTSWHPESNLEAVQKTCRQVLLRYGLLLTAYCLLVPMTISCRKENTQSQVDTYICPMHPTVVSDHPSTCPVCGMDLVRRAKPGEEVKITEDLAKLLKSPNEVVIADIKTVKSEFKSMNVTVDATGLVTYDTRYINTISTRIAGRLEKVYLKYAFQPVQKGQKIAEIYSQELVTAQRELLFLIEEDPTNSSLIDAAKNKLYLLGSTSEQVDAVIQSKEATYTFSIYSPHTGYIISNTAKTPELSMAPTPTSTSNDGMGGAMGSTSTPTQTSSVDNNSTELIRAGNYVNAGETLFKVVNASALRVELNLPASQSGAINLKDRLRLDFGNDQSAEGKVDFVQPFFNEGEEFNKVRVYVSGHELRIGQLVKASIDIKTSETLWLPKQAVLDLGLDRIVFVKDKGSFKPKNVVTGFRTDGWIEIKQGLLSADEVAENAQYLVDSESFIKSK